MSKIVDRMEEGIRALLDGKAAGYSYFIKDLSTPANDFKCHQNGYAVRPFDTSVAPKDFKSMQSWVSGVKQSCKKPMEIMSMSKTITAAAAVMLLHASNNRVVHLDSFIEPYLPKSWDRGAYVDQITFRHLLRHEVRWQEYEHPALATKDTGRIVSRYQNARRSIEEGLSDPPPRNYKYQNLNYGLFRVLIPYLRAKDTLNNMDPGADDTKKGKAAQQFFDLVLGAMYVQYVKDAILEPAALDAVDVVVPHDDTTSMPTRYYASNTDDKSVPDYAFPFGVVGGTDWKVSSKQFAQLLIALNAGIIAPKALLWDVMVTNRFGLHGFEPAGPGTGIVGHGGYGVDTPVNAGWICAPSSQSGKGIIVVAMANSKIEGIKSLLDPLHYIYMESI